MDRFESMRVFLTIVDSGSLSAAARALRIPLPTVSRRLTELEKHLGARLVTRGQRRAELTSWGKTYASTVRPLLERLEEAEAVVGREYEEVAGELTVSAPVCLGRNHVVPLVSEFLSANAKTTARILLVDRHVDLQEEHVDVAVRIGDIDGKTIVCTRVGEARRVVCASPDYLARRGVPMTPDDLALHDGVTFKGFTKIDGWAFERNGAGLMKEIPSRLALNNSEAAIHAAVGGLGLARVHSYQIVKELQSGMLVEVLGSYAPPPAPIHLIYARRGKLPLKVRAFLDLAAARLRKQLR
jgi:DNA-binding transcriptional LysR family regulator